MNKIDAKELDTRLEDLWRKAQKELKPGEIKLSTNNFIINAYRLKGIADGQIAWILYNLGVNATQLDDNPNHPGTGVQNFAYEGSNYNLLNASSLRSFVQTKSQKINPLFDKDVAWANTGGIGKGQDLTAEEKKFITNLNTAQAVHAGTVLLAYLRAIKKSTHPDNNYELNQNPGNSDRDWTIEATNQDTINAQIKSPVSDEQYRSLEDYANANKDTVKGLAWVQINTIFGKIASKVWNKVKVLNGQVFTNQFKTTQIIGNRMDRDWTQLTLGELKEIFGPESFNESSKYIGGGPIKPSEYLLLDKISQEKIDQALEKLKDKWVKPTYKGLTSKVLNGLLGSWDKKTKTWISLKIGKNLDFEGDLKEAKGYKIDEESAEETGLGISGKEIIAQEEKFRIEERGALLLKYFYKKAKFDVDKLENDKLENEEDFCRLTDRITKGGKTVKVLDTSGPGILPFGTGAGKTTKVTNCLVRGEKRNIVLVCPTAGLVDSAVGHHKNWLQDWECVYHKELDESGEQIWVDMTDKNGKPILDKEGNQIQCRKYIHHGKYKFANKDLVYNKETEEVENGLSILTLGFLFGYLTRDLFLQEYDEIMSNSKKKQSKKKWGNGLPTNK